MLMKKIEAIIEELKHLPSIDPAHYDWIEDCIKVLEKYIQPEKECENKEVEMDIDDAVCPICWAIDIKNYCPWCWVKIKRIESK